MNADTATRHSAGSQTIAITGAKGGVGKSNLSLNVAVALGKWSRRVLLVDGDLGLANLDVLLGLMPEHTVEHLVREEVELEQVLLEGPHGIRILPAASGVPQLARLDPSGRQRLVRLLARGAQQVDYVLVDTGAGLGEATLALQLTACRVIVVTTPEPTSMVDAYATLKVIWTAAPDKQVDLVVNAATDETDATRAYEQIARAARQFLGRAPGSLGSVLRDPCVSQAVRRQRALLELYPDCPAARCYERIATQLSSRPAAARADQDDWERFLLPTLEGASH